MRTGIFWMSVMVLSWLSSASAAGLDVANRLFLAGDLSGARAAAIADNSPDPQDILARDWLIALSHMHESAPRAALPYLERLVSNAPGIVRFRLELARALYMVEDDDRAKLHFEQAMGGDLSLTDINNIRAYLDRIDARKRWNGFVRFAIVPQTNPWRRSGESHVQIGNLIALPLPPIKNATTAQVAVGGTWLPQLGTDLRGRFHVAASGNLYSDSAYNSYSLRSELGLLATGDMGSQTGAGVSATVQYADTDRVMQAVGLYATVQRQPEPRHQFSLRGEVQSLRYRYAPAYDGLRIALSGQMAHAVSSQLRMTYGVDVSRHSAATDFHRRSQMGVTLGAQYAFEGGLIVHGEASLSHGRHDAPHPFTARHGAQRDTHLGLSARMLHRDVTYGGFAPVLELGLEHQSSNIPMHGFSNARVSLGVTRSF